LVPDNIILNFKIDVIKMIIWINFGKLRHNMKILTLFYQNWYDKFLLELPRTKKLRIISPFIGEQVIRNIHGRFDFKSFELITRFKLQDFAFGLSSLPALKFGIEMGAKIFGVKALHSKVYIFDNRVAIISSSNLTRGGLITNYECGLYTTDNKIISELHLYFDQLRSLSEQPLNVRQCEEWEKKIASIEIPKLPIADLPDLGATISNVNKNITYFVKFLGTLKNRAPLTLSVREELEEGECHYACGFSENKKPRQVRTGDIIFLARITDNPKDFAIFGKAETIQYVDGRDRATDNERKRLPWKEDWPIYLRLTNPVFIDGTMGDCVLLYDLIKTMDYQSFPSTQERHDNGERNINPYRSLSQRPIIPLTQQATEWLMPRFEECLKQMGQVPESFIANLPQGDLDIHSL